MLELFVRINLRNTVVLVVVVSVVVVVVDVCTSVVIVVHCVSKKKHPGHFRFQLEQKLSDFRNFWCRYS